MACRPVTVSEIQGSKESPDLLERGQQQSALSWLPLFRVDQGRS